MVEFHLGKLNTVADALSRQDADPGVLLAITGAQFQLFNDLRRETAANADSNDLIFSIRDWVWLRL